MKICFMGSMKFAVPILEGLYNNHDVLLVVTQPDKPAGRKKTITSTPVKNKALELGIKVFQPSSIKKDYSEILDLDLDFIIVAAYGQMIPEIVLNHAKNRAINVHASLLPKYRGGSPMHRAIQNGDSKTGITIMYMRKKMDSGEILAQEEVNITESDTVGTLEEKLSIVGRDLLIKTLKELPNIIPKTQDESQVTYAYNIKPIEEHIDFSQTAKQIYNHVRAFNPWPLTYFLIDGLKVKLYSVKYIDKNISSNIGEIVEVKKDRFSIQTKNGLIQPKVLQLQGKKKMDALSFMNGTGRTLFVKGKMVE